VEMEEDGVVAEQARILRQIQERNAAEAASLLLIQQLTMQAGCPPPSPPRVLCIRNFYIFCAIFLPVGILEQSMGARNRVVVPARQRM
jgi:hypothetical protein